MQSSEPACNRCGDRGLDSLGYARCLEISVETPGRAPGCPRTDQASPMADRFPERGTCSIPHGPLAPCTSLHSAAPHEERFPSLIGSLPEASSVRRRSVQGFEFSPGPAAPLRALQPFSTQSACMDIPDPSSPLLSSYQSNQSSPARPESADVPALIRVGAVRPESAGPIRVRRPDPSPCPPQSLAPLLILPYAPATMATCRQSTTARPAARGSDSEATELESQSR